MISPPSLEQLTAQASALAGSVQTASSDRRRGSLLLGIARLCAVLIIIVGSLFYAMHGGNDDELLATLPWFCVALACYLAPPFISSGTDMFSPPGVASLLGGLAVGAMLAAVLVDGGSALSFLGFLPELQRISLTRSALSLVIVGQLAYLLGYYRSSGTFFRAVFPNVSRRRWRGGRLLVAVLVSGAVFGGVYVLFQNRLGGSVLDLRQMAQGKQLLKNDPTLSWMYRGIEFGFVPVLLLCAAAIADRSRRLLFISLILFCIVSLLVMRAGQRGTAVMTGLMILVIFHFCWRRLPLVLVAGLLLVAVVAVNIFGEYRSTGEAQTSVAQGMARPLQTVATHENDRQRLNVLATIMHFFPERRDFLLGESYYGMAVALVPRWLWPGKAAFLEWGDTGIVYNLTGFPAPTPYYAVLYANFSWLGVVIGMAAFGAFHRGLYRYFEDSPRDPGTTLVYIAVLGTFSPTLMGISQALQFVAPIIVLVRAVSQPDPQRAQAVPAA